MTLVQIIVRRGGAVGEFGQTKMQTLFVELFLIFRDRFRGCDIKTRQKVENTPLIACTTLVQTFRRGASSKWIHTSVRLLSTMCFWFRSNLHILWFVYNDLWRILKWILRALPSVYWALAHFQDIRTKASDPKCCDQNWFLSTIMWKYKRLTHIS